MHSKHLHNDSKKVDNYEKNLKGKSIILKEKEKI